MLSVSDTSVSGSLSVFATHGIEVCLLVPTPTGMAKSIMDATEGVRRYLEASAFHCYSTQGQGEEHKVVKGNAYFVYPTHLEKTQISFYRPKTKGGDPRICFYGLKKYAQPYNLLALSVHAGSMFIFNCSDPMVMGALANPSSPIRDAIEVSPVSKMDGIAGELLEKLQDIAHQGYIPSMRNDSGGIGMTLQNLLGIPTDSSPNPDYKGIELKTKRAGKGHRSSGRVTLFGRRPNWDLSPIGSAWNLLSGYGYRDQNNRLSLYHQLDMLEPNSLGLSLGMDIQNDWLKCNFHEKGSSFGHHLATWKMDDLRERLTGKHNETFFVNVHSQGAGKDQTFQLVDVVHTKAPAISNLEALFEGGLITFDFTMHARSEQQEIVRDHGYLFKIEPKNIHALFGHYETYDLLA